MVDEHVPTGYTPASFHEQSGASDRRAAWADTWGR